MIDVRFGNKIKYIEGRFEFHHNGLYVEGIIIVGINANKVSIRDTYITLMAYVGNLDLLNLKLNKLKKGLQKKAEERFNPVMAK